MINRQATLERSPGPSPADDWVRGEVRHCLGEESDQGKGRCMVCWPHREGGTILLLGESSSRVVGPGKARRRGVKGQLRETQIRMFNPWKESGATITTQKKGCQVLMIGRGTCGGRQLRMVEA